MEHNTVQIISLLFTRPPGDSSTMHPSKLFKVLVLGGSVLISGCDEDTPADALSQRADADPMLEEPPPMTEPEMPDVADPAPVPLAPCFCDSSACCERDEAGNGTLQEGFECCWATTC